jgi:pimeloyl-ACP methyl ester carboxylesterase
MKRPDRTDVLVKTNKPVLFIIGRHDTAVPFNNSMSICHLPSLSYIHILEKAGHMGMLEQPDLSGKAMAGFLHDLTLYQEPPVSVVEN